MLYDFLNCPACIDIKQTLHYKVAIERSFYAFFLMFVSHFLVVVLDRLFFVRKTKAVAGCVGQVIVLHSNDCRGICLDGLSIGRL